MREDRENVTIWDDAPWECNGTFSMDAELFGAEGDTIIAMMPKIDSLINNWEVIGDYRSPHFWFFESFLTVRDGNFVGLFNNDYDLDTIPVNDLFPQLQPCLAVSSTNTIDASTVRIFPQPANSVLSIQMEEDGNYQWRVFDLNGRLLRQDRFQGNRESIETDYFPNGMYILQITQGEAILNRKVVISR